MSVRTVLSLEGSARHWARSCTDWNRHGDRAKLRGTATATPPTSLAARGKRAEGCVHSKSGEMNVGESVCEGL